MSWLLREKSDGRRAPGYLVYLLGGLAAVTAVWALHRRVASGDQPRTRPGPRERSNVASITQAAAAMAKVEVRNQPGEAGAPRYRLAEAGDRAEPATGQPPADTFDAIAAALQENATAPAAAESAAEPPGAGSADYARLPPALPAAAPHDTATQEEGDQLLGYRDPAADALELAAGTAAAGGPPPAADFRVPRGSLLRVFLLTQVDTGNPAAVIQFGAARDFIFNHRRQIPFGTRFLGKLSGQALRDRLNLTADTIVYPSGRELPISASAVEANDDATEIHPGVAADYRPAPAWAQIAPYLSDFFTGTLSLLETRAQPQLSVGVGGLNLQTGTAANDLRAPLYQSSAQAIQDYTQARLKEFEQRQGACYVIPAGAAFWLQLDADLDLDAAPARRGSDSR